MAARIIVLDSINSRWYMASPLQIYSFDFTDKKKEKNSYDLTPAATTTATATITATPAPHRSLDEDRGTRIGMV